MSGIVQDLRYALRGLRRNPAFTSVALVTLALGIGANTAMFSVLNAVLLRPLPYPASHELAMLWTERPNQNLREGRSAYHDVEEWRARSRTLADVGVFDPMTARLTAPGELERISTLRLSPNVFAILGVQAYRGRVFSTQEADERRRVAVVSYRFWQSRLGGADNVIGSTIELDGLPSEVIGILPADFRWSDSDVWEPHTLFPDWDVRRGERGDASWFVLARLRPNVTIEQAQGELSGIARGLDEQRIASEQGRGIGVMPLSLHIVGPRWRLTLWMLTGAVFFVLLIGVTNITSLSLARSTGRAREFALRAALGASRGRVLRQLFSESLVLAVLSGLGRSRRCLGRTSDHRGVQAGRSRHAGRGATRRSHSCVDAGAVDAHRCARGPRSRHHHDSLESSGAAARISPRDVGGRFRASYAPRARGGGIRAGDRAARRRRVADAQPDERAARQPWLQLRARALDAARDSTNRRDQSAG